MINRIKALLSSIFFAPNISDIGVDLRGSFPSINTDPEERDHRHNMEEWARATYEAQVDSANKNLRIMHRTVLVAIFTALIALGIGIWANLGKPKVEIINKVIVSKHN